jgi:catechol 2,3-dioxygenase-like lactoylglutathione lyase family enzyme
MLQASRIQSIICCSSSELAEEFYVTKLGLRRIRKAFNGLVVEANGGDLYLAEVPGAQPSEHTVVGFAVSDLDETLVGLAARGVEPDVIAGVSDSGTGIAVAPDGSRVAWLRDPDGNWLSVVQYPATFES